MLSGCTSTTTTPTTPTASGQLSTSVVTASGSGQSTASGPASSPTAAPRPTPSTAAQLGAVLQGIVLRSADLQQGQRPKLYDSGDQVKNQVTLDNCGYDFTSERYRVARRQYGTVDSTGAFTGLSNEVVAYDTAAHAALALRQARTAATTCPRTPVESSVAGVPTLTYRVSQVSTDSTLPVPTNVVTVESATDGERTQYNVSIYQVRGRYLNAVYVSGDSPLTSAQKSAAQRLATATGRRLLAAD